MGAVLTYIAHTPSGFIEDPIAPIPAMLPTHAPRDTPSTTSRPTYPTLIPHRANTAHPCLLICRYAVERKFHFKTADQQWLAAWFRKRKLPSKQGKGGEGRASAMTPRSATAGWSDLDDALYNARPWWHPRTAPKKYPRRGLALVAPRPAQAVSPVIWHWHGYKPEDVRCWLKSIQEV